MTAANYPADDSGLSSAIVSIGERLVRRLAPLAALIEHDVNQRAAVHESMTEALVALAALEHWGPQNRLPSSHLWNVAGKILSLGRLQRHAREKPHGYAGDFEMLNMICQDDRFGTGLAWSFDDFFQHQPAPTAVRNRAQIAAARMADLVRRQGGRTVHLASLGSGPAFDLQLLGDKLSAIPAGIPGSTIQLTLLDLDPHALEFATRRLGGRFPPGTIHSERVNLKRVIQNSRAMQTIARADFLSCPGFFDYLDHQQAVAMLSEFWARMKPESELLVFAFSEDNPSRAYMEWIGNWYLIYRSKAQMLQLADESGLSRGQYEVDTEAAGVNLFIHARKSA